MSKILTQDELTALAKYQALFDRAAKTSSIRGASVNISKEIAAIIDETPRHYNWGCGSCIINLYKRASKVYHDNLKRIQEEVERPTDEPNDTTDEQNDNIKNELDTRGRQTKPKTRQTKKVQSKA